MNTEHTPTPWKLTSVQKVHIASRGWFVDDPHDGSRIAFVFGEQSEELRANARLIETAPELLALLIDARDRMLGSSPAITSLRDRTDAAIAKVRGDAAA